MTFPDGSTRQSVYDRSLNYAATELKWLSAGKWSLLKSARRGDVWFGWSGASIMPRKIRELVHDLEQAGFINRGGRGSHRNFVHPNVAKPVTLSGNTGDDAKSYQERAVRRAIEESRS